MARTHIDKEQLRQRRAVLYDAIARGEVTLQHAVKEMRTISRLTQAQFAEHRGVSLKTIKEIESGKGNPTIQTLNRIGQFFGLEVAFVRTETLREKKIAPTSAGAISPQ
jgi:DNA-binding XRE family transcriptional regulator